MRHSRLILPIVILSALALVRIRASSSRVPPQQQAAQPATPPPPRAQAPALPPAPTSPPAPGATPAATPTAASAAGADAPDPHPPVLPPGEGRELVAYTCTQCHDLHRVVEAHKSELVWKVTVQDMLDRGADLDPADVPTVVAYLAHNFPKQPAPGGSSASVHVNQASADELASGLGVTSAQAAAIVDYRIHNGPFTGLSDLQKVPGLDPATVAGWTDKLVF